MCDVQISTNQYQEIRKTARKLVARSWDMLKLCAKVVEENEMLLSTMPLKDRVKERILREIEFERKFVDWKARNIKFLNLTDSKKKNEVKVFEFDQFCSAKGLLREKSTWENDMEREIEKKEAELKEMIDRKKLARSKKKKIELLRDCMKILQVVTGLNTFEDDLEEETKRLKKKVSSNSPASKFASTLNLEVVMPNVKRLAARLEPEDPNPLYSASDCGKFQEPKIISKPSRVYRSAGAHQPSLLQWTGPTHQWEARTGNVKEKVSNFCNPPTKPS